MSTKPRRNQQQFSNGVLASMPSHSLHKLIGEITSLLLVSSTHRHYQVRDIADVILPAVNLNQFQLYRDKKRQPIGLVTWGRLSNEVRTHYISGKVTLSEEELCSGEHLFFLDFIAPYGHIRQIGQHLKSNVFPNECAQALRIINSKPARKKILKLYGVNYQKPLN